MDQRAQIEARELQKKLLRVQCEIDRRELSNDAALLHQRLAAFRQTAGRARQIAPWVAAGAALAGLLVIRRGGRGLLSRLVGGIRLARGITPLIPAALFLFRRGPRRTVTGSLPRQERRPR